MSSSSHQNGSISHQNGLYPPSKKPKVENGIKNGVINRASEERSWKVRASRESHDCINPVRSCEEIYFKEALEKRDKSKELIKVSIGERERESQSCERCKLAIMCSTSRSLGSKC